MNFISVYIYSMSILLSFFFFFLSQEHEEGDESAYEESDNEISEEESDDEVEFPGKSAMATDIVFLTEACLVLSRTRLS